MTLRTTLIGALLLLGTVISRGAELTRTNLLQWQDQSGALHPVKNLDDWSKRRAAILAAMQEVMGPLPGPEKRCALDVEIESEEDCGSFVRRRLTYASEPGSRVHAYLLIPKAALESGEPAPGVLCLHQTRPQGNKVVAGLANSPNDEYGVELAKAGYVVIAPPYPLLADYHPEIKQLGYVSGTMKAIWDNMRALDLLESLPFVKKGGFASIGHSLGGHNGIYTAAFDPRIKVVVSSCGLDSYQDYMNGNIKGWTHLRYMPRLLDYELASIPFDFGEILAAIAPRTVFISAPTGDTNFKWQSVDKVAAAARPVFELHNASENLTVEHPETGHVFSLDMRRKAYHVIGSVLR